MSKVSALRLVAIEAFLAIFTLSFVAMAQTASVNGTVSDSSGALVQGANVTVHNTATNASRIVKTSGSGVYNITELPAGGYEVIIQKDGFRTVKYSAVTLTVDQALTLNAKMEVGGNAEQVTVEGNSVAPIDTTDAEVSNVVDEKQMQALPLILRDPYQLILLAPGTTQTNSGLNGFSINGGRERNNNFQLDGTNNNDPGVPGSGLLTLNPDATQEFRVISNNYLPEFGRNSSAVVDIISRSGTNRFNGDVYYFGRWNAFGARDYFNPEATTGKQSPYVRNTFGASFGGPLVQNKVFFFFNYEGNRFATATTSTAAVPTAAFKTGLFTYTDPQAGPINIDVSTPTAANNAFGLALDPQIQKILNYFPAANGPAVLQGISAEYFFGDTDHFTASNYLAKVDYEINSKNAVSVRYLAAKTNDDGGNTNVLPGIGGYTSIGLTQSLNGHLTTTFSPTLQNDFYATANRSFNSYPCNNYKAIDALSLAGLDPLGRGRDWDLPGFTSIGCVGLGDSNGQDRPFGTYGIGESITKIKGRHTLKFGVEFDDNYSNDYDDFSTRPTPAFNIFTQTGGFSALQNTSSTITNAVVQDSVWGLLGSVYNESQTQLFNFAGQRTPSDERGFRERDMYGYFQDQLKVKSNFTFNYGLRYEWNGVPWVVQDQLTSATPAALSGPAPIQFVRVTRGGSNPLYANDVKGFEPRLGMAWDPMKRGKMSIRAGYGIFRDRQFFNLTGDTRANPPFSLPYVNTLLPVIGPVTADQISNVPIPATQPAPGSTLPQFSFAFPATIDPKFHVPYVQQWNFGIQQELGGHFTLEINYVANTAHRLLRVVDGNAPNPVLVAKLRAYCSVPNPYNCYDSPTATPQQETVQGQNLYIGADLATFGFPNTLPFDAVSNSAAYHSNEVASRANSTNNGLQATLTKQFSHGMYLQANYTWAHAIDDASDAFYPQQNQTVFPPNSFFLGREKGNSSYDVRHRMVLNYVAELPFGRGKSYFNTGIVGRALEGWSWSGIVTIQTGFPFEIFDPGIDSDGSGATQRASYSTTPTSIPFASGLPVTGPNLGLFTSPLYGGPGNVQRNSFYGPGYKNFDMVLSKNTQISERLGLEFRSEYYNIFNHPNFQQPDNFITDATFGTSSAEVHRNDSTTGSRQLQFGMKLHF